MHTAASRLLEWQHECSVLDNFSFYSEHALALMATLAVCITSRNPQRAEQTPSARQANAFSIRSMGHQHARQRLSACIAGMLSMQCKTSSCSTGTLTMHAHTPQVTEQSLSACIVRHPQFAQQTPPACLLDILSMLSGFCCPPACLLDVLGMLSRFCWPAAC